MKRKYLILLLGEEVYNETVEVNLNVSATEIIEFISKMPTCYLLAVYKKKFNKNFTIEWEEMCN